jgi:hypothetical protein
MEDIQDRFAYVVALMLTAVAFKFITSTMVRAHVFSRQPTSVPLHCSPLLFLEQAREPVPVPIGAVSRVHLTDCLSPDGTFRVTSGAKDGVFDVSRLL